MMRKLLTISVAMLIGLTSSVVTVQAQQKHDQATCSKLVKSNPAYLVRNGNCAQACRAAIVRCMKGGKV